MSEHNKLEVLSFSQDKPKCGSQYTIGGLINAETRMKPIAKDNQVVFTVPILTPDNSQIVCEIWCENASSEPRFSSNWENIQMIIIQNATYSYQTEKFGMEIHFFTLPSWATKDRFIWLSAERSNFWSQPVLVPEIDLQFRQGVELEDTSVVKGVIQSSKNSVFGECWRNYQRKIHTHQLLGRTRFHQWALNKQYLKRDIENKKKYMFLVDGKTSPSCGREPLFST